MFLPLFLSHWCITCVRHSVASSGRFHEANEENTLCHSNFYTTKPRKRFVILTMFEQMIEHMLRNNNVCTETRKNIVILMVDTGKR
jgi:hypothetical protein